MKRDRTFEELPITLREWLYAILFALGLGMAVAYIGPRDLEDAEQLAKEQTAAIVKAAVNVAEVSK